MRLAEPDNTPEPNGRPLVGSQVEDAEIWLSHDPGSALAFPYRDLDRIAGRVMPGRLVFVTANTGHGKTTFLLNLTRQVLRQSVKMPHRIDYVGTEQEPSELWIKLACLGVGVSPHVPLNLQWEDGPPDARARVEEEIDFLYTAYGESGRLRLVPDKFITLARVERAAYDAAEAGQSVLIVDHIDRIETDGANEYQAMRQLVRRLKELARDCSLVLLVASQMNRKAREGDRLAPYLPPRLEHMRGAGTKEEEADIVLGVYRPIRVRPANVDRQDWVKLLTSVRRGESPASEVISRDRMGVTLMKHRTRSNEGDGCFLHVDHGVLSDEAIREETI